MNETKASGEDSWQQLSRALTDVAAAWRRAGTSQAESGPESTPAIHQLERTEAHALARSGYEAVEALAGLATVLSAQQDAVHAWESAQQAQREVWRHWRVAMDAQLPDEDTPP
ncbi:hypothetical protein DFQ14_104288 [Halopolyspora algeriensis]|uniref:Uncharacterized protein n=1 Tax=Halopolyspora algeriensis TaxID=1500506 RepID=A0A368VX21_9ACTN|nr:hypothetical protein [Halopolyspora algeriensis]RCW44697.1 hypothetical protein DFQ14_104288 [Halopolyspora algeriensis]TQM56054.1 hypothetical protein FHU43_0838 [Halopolyspora algeriensis]